MKERGLTLQDLIRRRQARGFVGRQAELGHFQDNLRLPIEDPLRRFLFSVHGDAGVGKSFLVRQFTRLAREQGYATAHVDESVFDVPTTMDTIATELAQQNRPLKEFAKRYEVYRTRRHELDTDPNTPEGLSSVLTRSAVRVGLRAAGDVPVVGPFTKELNPDVVAEQADRLRVYLSRKLKSQQDVRLLLAPVDELTPVFAADLRAVAEEQPLALLFDTFERTGAFLNQWLLDLLSDRHGGLPPDLVLVVAGQHPLDVNVWGDYLGIRCDIALEVFTDGEARELLASRGVTDPDVVEAILGLTGRLPVLVALLAEAKPDSTDEVTDPSDDAVERFLKWERDEQRRNAALRGALPRRLDKETFAAATESAALDEDFAWLRGLPFVAEHTDGYRYHGVVRSTMLRVQRRRSPAEWQQRHRNLAEHCTAASAELGLTGNAALTNDRWQALAVEESYHRLCADPVTALPATLAALVATIDRNPDATVRWAAMIHQAGTDSAAQHIADLGRQFVDWADENDGLIQLLARLATEPTLDDHHRAIAYGERGNRLSQDNRLDEALADFDRSIELDDTITWIIGGRGEIYRRLGRYDEALTELNRAIERDPDYFWALDERGEVYRLLDRYDEAIADFDKVVDGTEPFEWTLTSRGQAHNSKAEYELALADFDRALVIAPDWGWALGLRGSALVRLDRHDEAIAAYSRAIELDPGRAWCVGQRGEAYRLTDQPDMALADFDRAVEMNPDYAWAFGCRGQLHHTQERYADALADFNHAIAIDPDSRWCRAERGAVYRHLGRYDEAMADFRETVQDDPDDGFDHYQLGVTELCRGNTDAGRAHITNALELDRRTLEHHGPDERLDANIALYLCALNRPEEARQQLERVLARGATRADLRDGLHLVGRLRDEVGVDAEALLEMLEAAYRAASTG